MSDTRRDDQDADWWQRAGDRFDQLREDFNQRYDGDEDGLSLAREMELGTSDLEEDTDGDGIDDGDEVAAGSDPTVDDAGADPDQDGLTNEEEAEHGTRADRADTDGDGIDDADEVKIGTSPTNADTDGDLLTDGFEVFESETDPVRADSKGDGVDDAFRDGDGDGSPHLREQVRQTDPLNAISDPESGKTDGGEPIDRFLSRNAAEARDTITEADAAPAEVAARQTTDSGSAEPGEQEGGFWDTVGDLGSAAYDRAHRWRFDQDGDGLTRLEEKKHGTSDETVDTDGDGIPDPWEIQHPHADPLAKDAHTDPDGDGETLAEEYAKHPDEPRDGIKVDATDSHLRYELVGDGDADYEFIPAGPYAPKTGHGVVTDRETGEEVDPESLRPGTRVLFPNEEWRLRREPTEEEANGTPGDDRSRMDTEPPPAGEREPDGWEDGEGEGEAAAGVGDPTSMRIGIDEPVVEQAEPSVIEMLNRGGGGSPGADLGRAAPEPTEENPSPVGQAVDPDQVAADRFGRGATSIFEGTGAAAATDPTPSGDAVAAVRTSRLDQDGVGPAGRDTTGQGDSGTTPSGDGEEESDEASSDEEDSHDDGQENDEAGSTDEDETEDETEPDVRQSVNEYDAATGKTTTYYVDEAGNVYDQDGNPVPPDQVPQWVRDAADSSDGDGGGESGDAASSGGVSTTVDPDGGFGDRTKGEAIEDELGAPTGPPRGPIDPQEAENGVEGRSLRHLITSDDLAQPVPGEAIPVGGRGISSNANASGGRFGTGAIDYGPDHVTHETGPYQDEDVPGAVRTPDDDDGGGGGGDHLTEAPRGIALTAEPVNEPEPLQAIATDGREQGLSPQSDDADPTATAPDDEGDDGTWTDPVDDGGWTDPVDEYPAFPEVAEDGFEDRSFEPEPEPEPADLGAEPDRFEGIEELL